MTETEALPLAQQFARAKRGIFFHGKDDLGVAGVTQDDVFDVISRAATCVQTPRAFYWGSIADGQPVDDLFGFDGNLASGASVRVIVSLSPEVMIIWRVYPK